MEKWHPPPADWYKINFDTVIRDSFSIQAAVFRNAFGHIIQMISQVSEHCLPNYGEAPAARLVVSLASSLMLGKFIIEVTLKL